MLFNEDKQNRVSNIRLFILNHFISAINIPICTDRHPCTIRFILTEIWEYRMLFPAP